MMKEVFSNRHVVLPVIHMETEDQVLQNANIARENGADGVFLIQMRNPNYEKVNQLQKLVNDEFGNDWWIGVNHLDLPTIRVFNCLNKEVSGVWVDNAEIYEWQDKQIIAEKINQVRKKSNFKGLYFGGVAFKYQQRVDNLELVAKIATRYMDVVTTSGDGTGMAPEVSKIEIMKSAIGDHPLAIASGITPRNVKDYSMADCFIVATSLLKPGTEYFDVDKMKRLVDGVRNI